MAYSDYTLEKAVDKLEIKIEENANLFKEIPEAEIPLLLRLNFENEFAFSTNSEKARSEMLIAPILNEIFKGKPGVPRRFTIFSGENFDVDKDLDLKGLADFLICLTNTKFLIQAPIIAVAESKRNTPEDGLGQCVSELFAAALFNKRKNNENKIIEKLFGISTNGNDWIFAEYWVNDNKFIYDPVQYSIRELPRIIGILSFMRDEALRMYDKPNS